ncbi:MAG: HigA family addiction module antidote protein [Lentisphaerae bacterium]|nr:HigA family addiction module antidote protein [Lentisphaerota bacterium]
MNIEQEKVINVTERKVCPSHPGEILKGLYLSSTKLTITDLADDMGVARKTVSAIVNSHNSVTSEMAMRLSKALQTSPQFWLNLQNNYDIWQLANKKHEIFAKIKPLPLVHA